MELNNKYTTLVFLLICFTPFLLIGQDEYVAVERARYDGEYLRLTFINCSHEVLLAPDLEKRLGNNRPTLFEEYWGTTGDTISIKITREVSRSLYDVINREGGTTNGKLFYTDSLIKPGKRYRSKVRIVIPDNVKVLKMGAYILPLCR